VRLLKAHAWKACNTESAGRRVFFDPRGSTPPPLPTLASPAGAFSISKALSRPFRQYPSKTETTALRRLQDGRYSGSGIEKCARPDLTAGGAHEYYLLHLIYNKTKSSRTITLQQSRFAFISFVFLTTLVSWREHRNRAAYPE